MQLAEIPSKAASFAMFYISLPPSIFETMNHFSAGKYQAVADLKLDVNWQFVLSQHHRLSKDRINTLRLLDEKQANFFEQLGIHICEKLENGFVSAKFLKFERWRGSGLKSISPTETKSLSLTHLLKLQFFKVFLETNQFVNGIMQN